jgi:hypothetical protein
MVGEKEKSRDVFRGSTRSNERNGRAGQSVRPDKSQNHRHRASNPNVSAVAAELAAREGPAPLGHRARLGLALAGLTQELAAARREIAVLKRENKALRSRLDGGTPDT